MAISLVLFVAGLGRVDRSFTLPKMSDASESLMTAAVELAGSPVLRT
ncbi:MAG: hypothetical protein RQ826_08155 [Xanthomonadales bacterium]|nr:hypothetical protein [Xanthomonadales bacterium]